ncbi:hypothetical protein niasHT_032028 [Heterodera trifolii]|uniref:Uncharacterized protein n=1 Tax=Heterodera trifolii TaxID=157864 RepID=A0ABD2IF05_9BILA
MESPAQRMFKREIRTPLDRIWVRTEEKRKQIAKKKNCGGKKGDVIYVLSIEGDESPDRPVHVHYLKPRRPAFPEGSKAFP